MNYDVYREDDKIHVFAYDKYADSGTELTKEEAIAFAHEILKAAEEEPPCSFK